MFENGSAFPAAYKGGAFIGEHGSWDRQKPNGYAVAFVPFSGGRPSGKATTFVGGFTGKNHETYGRPVGVAFDRSGALLVADDLGGVIWRVAAKAAPAAPPASG